MSIVGFGHESVKCPHVIGMASGIGGISQWCIKNSSILKGQLIHWSQGKSDKPCVRKFLEDAVLTFMEKYIFCFYISMNIYAQTLICKKETY
jgi:hypothetical protein